MKCDRFQRILADYIAGELSSPDRTEAQAHAAACSACASELAGLQSAAAVLDSGRITTADAERRAEVLPAPSQMTSAPPPRRSLVPALLRYAAVIAFSFATGYAIRGGGPSAATDGPRLAAAPASTAPVIDRYNAVTRERPEASSFSRSLLALAAPSRGKS